ncbi:MAG: 4-alpha-glucanotransferase [Lachnospiraceae bacterium]|nr:4-alpha-glucanotransferase [Lachnospiraceae bacterium]
MKQSISKLGRGAGVLMPISALPGPYGIGTLGKNAYEFADFAAESGYSYWQVLPVGPTSFGDSPYQSFSAFAGNPYFIDLEQLAEEGLLEKEELNSNCFGETLDDIDYAAVFHNRFEVLKKAYQRSGHKDTAEYHAFLQKTAYWIEDYSFYMALKFHFENRSWQEWEENIKLRRPETVEQYRNQLAEEIDFWKFCQFKFREQWDALKVYVNQLGMKFIGDIPLYVAMDSSDVWVHKDLFELDEDCEPIHIAGVPPDIFSADGQRWGNPLYRWDVMEQQDFAWWRERMKANAALYDVIRIDHFIGTVNYWSIEVSCPTAVDGEWKQGPGEKLMNAIMESIGDAAIIAEDLGVLTQPVKDLIAKMGYPGMKIIEFGMDCNPDNEYLPHNYESNNIVAYIGTHDNETLVGFLKNCSPEQIEKNLEYFQSDSLEKLPDQIIRSLFACVANVVIVQMQDLLKLDNRARTNLPSSVGKNWRWRMTKEQYQEIDTAYYKKLCNMYNRARKENSNQD